MLCDWMSSALVSEFTVSVTLRSLSGLLIGMVEEEDSDERRAAWTVRDSGRGVISVEGMISGKASIIAGESGAMSCFSFMDSIILSSLNGVMCFSLPRLVAKVGSIVCDCGRRMSKGAVLECAGG